MQSGRLTRHVRELYLDRARTLAFSACISSDYIYVVLGTSFVCQAFNPMMPYGRPGNVAKHVTMLVVYAHVWSTMLLYGLQQSGALLVVVNVIIVIK